MSLVTVNMQGYQIQWGNQLLSDTVTLEKADAIKVLARIKELSGINVVPTDVTLSEVEAKLQQTVEELTIENEDLQKQLADIEDGNKENGVNYDTLKQKYDALVSQVNSDEQRLRIEAEASTAPKV